MTDLKERAIRAATERGTSNAEQLAAMETVRRATVEDWLARRLYRLMRRILDTDMTLSDLTVREAAVPPVDWTRASLTGSLNGLTFGTSGVFDHLGGNLPVSDSALLVWIPCATCGHESGPFEVGSLSGLGCLLNTWEHCETCRAAAAGTDYPDLDSSCGGEDAPDNYPAVPSTPRVTVDRERMEARRKQGGGREALR
jgi:hypothetical protein